MAAIVILESTLTTGPTSSGLIQSSTPTRATVTHVHCDMRPAASSPTTAATRAKRLGAWGAGAWESSMGCPSVVPGAETVHELVPEDLHFRVVVEAVGLQRR